MIKCKEDLLNTYIKTGDDKLIKLYIEKLSEYELHDIKQVPLETYYNKADRGSNRFIAVSPLIGIAQWWECKYYRNYKELTLEDFEDGEKSNEPDSVIFAQDNKQPVSKYKYTPLDVQSAFDLKEMFEKGEIYFQAWGDRDDNSFGAVYDQIVDEDMLFTRWHEKRLLLREEMKWQEQISGEYNFTYVEKEDSFVQTGCTSSEDMIKFAKRVLELSGELKSSL